MQLQPKTTLTPANPAPLHGGMLQRKCACGQHTVAGGRCDECGKKNLSLQRATRTSEPETRDSGGVPSIVHEVLRSPGQPLDSQTRSFFEPRFAHDLSRVRVHTDKRAAESAQAVNALAYTVGQEMVFGAGQYDSYSQSGRRLLAHELTHVMQQGAGVARLQERLFVSDAGDSSEQEAERVAEAVVGGQSVSSNLPGVVLPGSLIQRLEGPCEDIPAAHRLLNRGSLDPAVREAQRKLNVFHDQQVKAGNPGLADAPLIADCIFGEHTFNAVLSFQQQVFPGQPGEHDGKIGDHTWAELDKVTALPTPVTPTPPTPTPRPPTPAPTPPAAVGPSCLSAPPVLVPGPPLLFEHDSTTLVAGQGPLLASLIADARCALRIELHGNASASDGTRSHNVALACRRASAIAVTMTGVTAPIKLISHGPTTAFGPTNEPNRNVVVAITPRVTPAPLPSRNVVPGVTTPTVIGTFAPPGGCGAGDDFLSFPAAGAPGPLSSRLIISGERPLSDSALETVFHTELVTAAGAGAPGSFAIAHFMGGAGTTVVHGPGTVLQTLMLASPIFSTAVSTVDSDILAQVRAQTAAGAIDFRALSVIPPIIHFPATRTGFGSGPLAGVIGGTQGVTLSIINFQVIPCTRAYVARLRFDICDDFGVDQPDVRSPGLGAFWLLQHERPGHKPFINQLIADVPIAGAF